MAFRAEFIPWVMVVAPDDVSAFGLLTVKIRSPKKFSDISCVGIALDSLNASKIFGSDLFSMCRFNGHSPPTGRKRVTSLYFTCFTYKSPAVELAATNTGHISIGRCENRLYLSISMCRGVDDDNDGVIVVVVCDDVDDDD